MLVSYFQFYADKYRKYLSKKPKNKHYFIGTGYFMTFFT